MSWALLLSKFPRSILQDEQPLLVLSILERAGLATEKELAEMLGSDEKTTKSMLMRLQMDELAEYGSSHVRLSEKGREVLDRLSLNSDILDDVLDSLALKGQDRSDIQRLLEAYRRTSFRLYQNSLCTLRQWLSLSRFLLKERTRPNQGDATKAGMRSLLLRDLSNWLTHSRSAEASLDNLGDATRRMILWHDSGHETLYRRYDHAHNCTVYLLHALTHPDADPPSKDDRWQECVMLSALFHDFHFFQASWQPDMWFDKWVTEIKLPDSRRFRNAERYVVRLRDALRSASGDLSSRQTHEDSLSLFYETWTPSSVGLQFGDNFLSDLLVANDMPDLSRRCGIEAGSLTLLVATLHRACEGLLRREPTESPDAKEEPQQSASPLRVTLR